MSSPHAALGLHIAIDCLDPVRITQFWCEALGYRSGPPGDPFTTLFPAIGGPELVLQRVDTAKVGKNRMHLDLRVRDHDAEVRRLEHAGARVLKSYEEPGWKWSVMLDPEGNEFCVLQPTDPTVIKVGAESGQ